MMMAFKIALFITFCNLALSEPFYPLGIPEKFRPYLVDPGNISPLRPLGNKNPSTYRETYNPSRIRETYNPSRIHETYNPSRFRETYNPSTIPGGFNPFSYPGNFRPSSNPNYNVYQFKQGIPYNRHIIPVLIFPQSSGIYQPTRNQNFALPFPQIPYNPIHPLLWNSLISPNQLVRYSNQCSSASRNGTCYNQQECKNRKGSVGQGLYCADFRLQCCTSRHSCGESTDVPLSYFRSTESSISSDCAMTINKESSDMCGVRIRMMKMKLPASTGYCDGIGIEPSTTSNKFQLLCGNLDDQSYDIEFKSSNAVKLTVKTNMKLRMTWKVYITQMKCSDSIKTSWPLEGHQPAATKLGQETTTKKPIETETEKPKTVTEDQSSTTAASNPARKCGFSKRLSLIPSNVRVRDDDEEEVSEAIHECIDETGLNICSKDLSNPLLTDIVWDVPTVNQSDLYKYAGKQPEILDGRITFGKKTKPNEYPWAVAMYSNGRFHCGASLISDRHILTAAHCVIRKKRRPSALRLSIGDWNINSQTDGTNVNGQVAKITTHPGYSTVTLKFDVAVLTLKDKVKFTDRIQPICLPATDSNIDNDLATVIGWGRNEKNLLQSILMKHEAAIVTNSDCSSRWQKKGAPASLIASEMVCMNPQYGDSCKGDSGGPAIMSNSAGIFEQVGIVSFGSASCTDKNLPGVYTRVSKVSSWIQSEMNKP